MHNNKELTKLWSKGHRIQNPASVVKKLLSVRAQTKESEKSKSNFLPFRIEDNLGKNHDVPRSETLIILIAEINIKIQQRVDAESEQ